VNVPGGRTAGMSPSDVFCSFVSFASVRLLPVVQAAPWLLPLTGVAILGMVFVTIYNTEFAPSPVPLRRRRQAGQILRTALMLYRTHARLMLGVAIAFIPAGLVASELQFVTFGLAPIRALLDVIVITRAGEAAIGLALGTTVFGATYFFVVPAVVAALGGIERGERVTPLDAYAAAWSCAWDLFRARMLAVAIVAALAVTVVGIPWAIRRAVSWAFIEQAVLLDRQGWRDALLASEAAVRGHWWRTAVIAGLLLGFGLVASLVIVAPVLLVATNVPLSTVNTMASIIYIVLAPFVALALTLLYFDIKSRQQQGAPGAVRLR
jgi:hypothetical protein